MKTESKMYMTQNTDQGKTKGAKRDQSEAYQITY